MALAVPPILRGGVLPEVLDDDLGLLRQVGGVQGHEPGDGPPGLGRSRTRGPRRRPSRSASRSGRSCSWRARRG